MAPFPLPLLTLVPAVVPMHGSAWANATLFVLANAHRATKGEIVEVWYVILGLFALAGLFWLASLSQNMMRLLMIAWGICNVVIGVGLVGTLTLLAEVPWSSTVDAIGGLLLFFAAGLGVYVIYAGYRLIRAAIREWE